MIEQHSGECRSEEVEQGEEEGETKDNTAAGWRELRQRNRTPFPRVEFLYLNDSGGMRKTRKSKKEEASLTETARLLYGVFIHLPSDVRRTVVSFV